MKKTLALTALIAATLALSCRGAFPYNTSTGAFNAATSATGAYNAFNWIWFGYDDVQISVQLLPVGATTASVRLCKDRRGISYLDVLNGTLSGSNYTATISRTNIPPDGQYFCEILGSTALTSGTTRVMATGKVTVQRSLYANTGAWTNPATGVWFLIPTNQVILTNQVDGTTIIYSNGVLQAIAPASPDVICRANLAAHTNAPISTAHTGVLTNAQLPSNVLTNGALYATAAQGARADVAITQLTASAIGAAGGLTNAAAFDAAGAALAASNALNSRVDGVTNGAALGATAYGWGNHAGLYDLLGASSAVSNWAAAYAYKASNPSNYITLAQVPADSDTLASVVARGNAASGIDYLIATNYMKVSDGSLSAWLWPYALRFNVAPFTTISKTGVVRDVTGGDGKFVAWPTPANATTFATLLDIPASSNYVQAAAASTSYYPMASGIAASNLAAGAVATNNPTYTATVAKAASALQAESDTLQTVVSRGGSVTSGIVTIDAANERTNTYGGLIGIGPRRYQAAGGDVTGENADSSWSMGDYSVASGSSAWAFGYGAKATNNYSFVWVSSAVAPSYGSHGLGTFNVNPSGGLGGIWIGEDNLSSLFGAKLSTNGSASGLSGCPSGALSNNQTGVTLGFTSATGPRGTLSNDFVTVAQLEERTSLLGQEFYGATNVHPTEAAFRQFVPAPPSPWSQAYALSIGTNSIGSRLTTNTYTRIPAGLYIHTVYMQRSIAYEPGQEVGYWSQLVAIDSVTHSTNVLGTASIAQVTEIPVTAYQSSTTVTNDYYPANPCYLGVLRFATRVGAAITITVNGGTTYPTHMDTPSLNLSAGINNVIVGISTGTVSGGVATVPLTSAAIAAAGGLTNISINGTAFTVSGGMATGTVASGGSESVTNTATRVMTNLVAFPNGLSIAGTTITGVSSNPFVGFVAWPTNEANVSCGGSSYSTLMFQAKTNDAYNLFNTSTAGFTPNQNGLWRVSARCWVNHDLGATTGSANNRFDLALTDAADNPYITHTIPGGLTPSISFSQVLYMNTNTTYYVKVYNYNASARNVYQGGPRYQFFSAEFVSP